MPVILIVDDDAHIRELVRVFLEQSGFSTLEASDGNEALAVLERNKVDLVVLDIMMPNRDGWSMCEELRKDYELPVLMLTAKAETVHKVRGFEIGADDYLVKPFEPAELVVRVKALLKRYRIEASQIVQVGELFMNRRTFEVVMNGQGVTIPLKEFELLFKLASNLGRTISREQLIEDIWGFDYQGNERTLDVHVNRLRDKLEEFGCSCLIKTIRGLGYRLEAGGA
ncbi:response regulator transcription factor [Paenibacillus rigui]|uniref:Heme response regulator HssR n=1 Tax=Paenibacillus rigui TaxID=554312 RepID=A0A229UV41_9BACL|nr:response regulator transcription factor [Paenibacillus rigui]OXM87272.1 DNA-binding response regulator [Paenibacillus rigui]